MLGKFCLLSFLMCYSVLLLRMLKVLFRFEMVCVLVSCSVMLCVISIMFSVVMKGGSLSWVM